MRINGKSHTEAELQFWADVGLACVTALGTVSAAVLLLEEADRPSWLSDGLLIRVVIVSALLSFLRALVLARGRRHTVADESRRRIVNQAGIGLLGAVSDAAELKHYEPAVHVFLYDPGFLRNRVWLRRKTDLFRRIVNLRHPHDRRHSGLTLRPGVGAVGVAYETGEFAVQPLAQDYTRYERDRAAWEAKPSLDRGGLSHGQLMSCFGYGLVCAYPIRDRRGDVVGCVAVDGPAKAEIVMMDAIDDIKDAMADAAQTIRRLLFFEDVSD